MTYRELIEGQIAHQAAGVLARRGFDKPSVERAATTANLKPFVPGALGNFPYYWQDPNNLLFNAKTYRWISAALLAGANPIQLAQPFTNLFINVFSKLSYSLSSSDQEALRRAQRQIQNQQGALLTAYKGAFGSLPPLQPGEVAIDAVLRVITTQWASPPTSLRQLQFASDIEAILDKTPLQGESVLPALGNYLAALDQSLPLQNAVTMNTGYLVSALDAAQFPSAQNGGLRLNDGQIVPAFSVSTPLAQILAGLDSGSAQSRVQSNISVSGLPNGRVQISPLSAGGSRGGTAQVAAKDFLGIDSSRAKNLLSRALGAPSSGAPSASQLTVDLDFPGATMVYFGPSSFQMSNHNDWFWPQPIVEALANGSKDVTGFRFSPEPHVDFSSSGPFAFLVGVAISRHPSITLRAPSGVASDRLLRAFPKGTPEEAKVELLGHRLGDTEQSTYLATPRRLDSGSTEIMLQPQRASDSVDSTAYVLGVLPTYPAAD